MSTIAAISTPDSMGGISVIRISGENAVAVAERIFSPHGNKKVSEMPEYASEGSDRYPVPHHDR